MTLGAFVALLSGSISPGRALASIQPDVMLFLLGMFLLGEGVRHAGLIHMTAGWIGKMSDRPDVILLVIIVLTGFASAILMNDTIAIIGTPLVLILADRCGLDRKMMLLALCFALTTGSVPSPIGNPQNYLIATSIPGIEPFTLFLSGLFVPTVFSMVVIWMIMRHDGNRSDSCRESVVPDIPLVTDRRSIFAVFLAIFVLIGLILIRTAGEITGYDSGISLSVAALVAAMVVIAGARQRREIIAGLDWRTLIFFAAMFVLMQSVYDTGVFSAISSQSVLFSPFILLGGGIILSQLISNVPFVALFLPAITGTGLSDEQVLALAAGSTLAGNLTILGAASNIIVLSRAEQLGIILTQREFVRYGFPVTIIQAGIYWIFLGIF